MAQGNLIVGGAGASAGGSKVQVNSLNAGRVPDGATVERSVPTPLNQGDTLQFDLNANDFNTAREVARAINRRMGEGVAQALDGRVGARAHAAVARGARGLPRRHREPAARACRAGGARSCSTRAPAPS